MPFEWVVWKKKRKDLSSKACSKIFHLLYLCLFLSAGCLSDGSLSQEPFSKRSHLVVCADKQKDSFLSLLLVCSGFMTDTQ